MKPPQFKTDLHEQMRTGEDWLFPYSYRNMAPLAATNGLVYKCQNIVKNVHQNFQEPRVTSSDCTVCPTNGPKPKDSKDYYHK